MKRTDIISSIVIGEAAALLMLAVGRNLNLPPSVAGYLWILLAVFPLFTGLFMIAGSIAGRRVPVAYQFSKFVLVGGLNFLIDLGVLNLLIAATGNTTGFWASIFKALSFLVAVVSSFFWNKFWTFTSLDTDRTAIQFVEFFIVSGIGLAINVGAFATFNALGPAGAIPPTTWVSIAAAGAAIVGLVWNFLGYKFLVFRRKS